MLILDEGSRPALEVVRSLGRKNIIITIATPDGKRTLASFSKYISKRSSYPPFKQAPEKFLDSLISTLKTNKYDMIVPVGQDTTEIVLKNKQEISKYTIVPLADYATWLKAEDKGQTLQAAIDLGIPCPITYFKEITDINDISGIIDFPVIIKPRVGYGSGGVTLIKSSGYFMEKYKEIKSKYGLPLVQEYIPPGLNGYGVSMIFNNCVPVASFTHKRLREYPINGGPSTLRVSISDQTLEGYATKLLKYLNWHGVAMVEFKCDPRDKKYKLMEINPRFWGSLPLAIYSGVDFPYILYEMHTGGKIQDGFTYRTGIKSRWLVGDILWLLNYPDKRYAIKQFFSLDNKTYFDILSLDDPLPAFGELSIGLKNLSDKEVRLQMLNRGF